MSSDLVGKTIGKYRIVARLGRGGMAEVYKGYQPGLDRYVAVKVLHSHLADEEDFIGRFEREATAVARLRHPNIVQVYDFDVEGSTYYMVMEFVEGPTLKAELKERSMKGQIFSLPEISRIFSALASAIDYAHSRGMVHRDLKPANVMFTAEGQVVLTDFGIARIMGATRYTMTGAISGTPAYMSPEQGQGERGDERSDIYSLGVILYEMVTGRVPFDADTPFAIIMKHINDPLPLPTTVNSAVPEVVERIILKAMSKNPADRYQSAGEMAKALRDALGVSADQTLAAMPISTIAPAPRLQEVTVAPGLDRTPTPAPGRVTQGGTMATAAQTAMPAAVGGLPVLPLALGAGAILVVCLIALAIIGTRVFTKTQMEQEAINLTQTALAIAMATEGVDTPTPVPTATATSAPTDTSTPAPTPTERVVVVTSTPLPATDTPTPLPPTDTPTPAPPTPTPKPVVVAPTRTPTPAPPTATPSPQAPAISGRLAIPIDDGAGHYNVVIYQLPGGNILGKIPRSRQPNFNPKGGTLLVNGEGGDHENIWEYNADGSGGRAVTGSPDDEHPFYNVDGNSLVYDNPGLVTAKLGRRPEWHVFVQYGLVPVETGLVARDQVLLGDIFDGSTPMYPVWASDYSILFRACDYWKSGGGGSCGIWKADSGMTRAGGGAQSNPAFIVGDNAQPTDTKGSRLIYMSQAGGNWDVYSTSLSGGAGTKLTDSPADDGLGTLSPDGQWLAFVSTRDGRWGVWVMPVSGGSAQRLPIDVPSWVNGYGGWASERISWGP
jgi:tRNA A-37 threonylcarbamoyl transferase component Bud32